MIDLKRLIFFIIFVFLLPGCTEKISYTGKIITEKYLNFNNLNAKKDIIENLGIPNYIDPIENKYYYFSEKIIQKNFYDNQLDNRKLIVFDFNDDETIKSIEEFDLTDQKNTEIVSNTTQNNLIKQGWVENIFGGVGKGPIAP